MTEAGTRLRVALAAVFGVVAALFVVLGVTVTPVALGIAVPFVLVAYALWRQATRRRVRREGRGGVGGRHRGRRRRRPGGSGGGRAGPRRPDPERDAITRSEALSVLGLEEGADDAAVRRAYRDRVKDVHPDQGGDEEAFERVNRAYDRLRDGQER